MGDGTRGAARSAKERAQLGSTWAPRRRSKLFARQPSEAADANPSLAEMKAPHDRCTAHAQWHLV